MTSTNVQGTTTYILDVPGSAWADCAAATPAILLGEKAMCPQSLGDLARTRAVTEYSCISSNDSVKSTGKISYGDFSIELLYDPNTSPTSKEGGQKALFDAMEANTAIIIAMEADNADVSGGTTDAAGELVWTEAFVSGDTIGYPVDGKMLYNVTLSPYGGFLRCPGIAGTT